MPTIRVATAADAAAVTAIYAPAVTDAPTSFEIEPPDAAEMARRIADTLARFPWLICDRDGEILGFVRAGRFRERPAYQWSVEVSTYVRPDAQRFGVARALYTSLFALLVRQGFFMAFGAIALPNPASVALHEAMGFTRVGVFRAAGYKLDSWHDVGWWQRPLQTLVDRPPRPRPFALIAASSDVAVTLAAGLPLLRV